MPIATRCILLVLTALAPLLSLPSDIARDCPQCPELVMIPAGEFLMGTAAENRLIDPRTGKPATNDGPQHKVTISTPFALGRYEVTVAEYARFVNATGYANAGACMGFGGDNRFVSSKDINWRDIGQIQSDTAPVVCVSYYDAVAYAEWLTDVTGETYRLPTEAEWEYAARAGSTSSYHWGADAADACEYANVRTVGAQSISQRQADSDVADGFPCDDGHPAAAAVGSFRPNAFGLHDMQGNAWEWVADCNHKNYEGAPTDGSAWLDARGECAFGMIRGGSFLNRVERSSTTVRVGRPRSGRGTNMGFRIARGGKSAGTEQPMQQFIVDTDVDADTPGGQLFNDHCAACHQQRGNLRGVYGKDFDAIANTIRSGGNNIMSMPAFGDTLSDDDIAILTRYLRRVNGWDQSLH